VRAQSQLFPQLLPGPHLLVLHQLDLLERVQGVEAAAAEHDLGRCVIEELERVARVAAALADGGRGSLDDVPFQVAEFPAAPDLGVVESAGQEAGRLNSGLSASLDERGTGDDRVDVDTGLALLRFGLAPEAAAVGAVQVDGLAERSAVMLDAERGSKPVATA
jgi:hypothetical protein